MSASTVSFGSTPVRITKVLNATSGKAENVIFSKLNFLDKFDALAIDNLKKVWLSDKNFGLCSLFEEIADSFLNEKCSYDSFYALERKASKLPLEQRILGVVKVFTDKGNRRIDYIQVGPESLCAGAQREYKKVGQSLMNNIVKSMKQENAANITLLSMADSFFNSIGIPITRQYKACSDRAFSKNLFNRIIANTEIC